MQSSACRLPIQSGAHPGTHSASPQHCPLPRRRSWVGCLSLAGCSRSLSSNWATARAVATAACASSKSYSEAGSAGWGTPHTRDRRATSLQGPICSRNERLSGVSQRGQGRGITLCTGACSREVSATRCAGSSKCTQAGGATALRRRSCSRGTAGAVMSSSPCNGHGGIGAGCAPVQLSDSRRGSLQCSWLGRWALWAMDQCKLLRPPKNAIACRVEGC